MSENIEKTISIDVSPLLNGKLDSMNFTLDWNDVPDFFGGITPSYPVKVNGKLSAKPGYFDLSLNIDMDYTSECSRCLKTISKKASLHTEKTVMIDGTLNDDNDDYLVVDGTTLRLDETCEELLFLDLPSRELCSEDCKGICQKCGKDLNDGPCDCKKEIDPRMEVFRKFLTDENDDL